MKKTETNKIFTALSAAAMALPGVSSQMANAVAIEPGYSLSVRSSKYSEEDIPLENLNPQIHDSDIERYEIDVQQVMFRAALGDTKELTISALTEEMTGASPWFISEVDGEDVVTMSSASGGLIEEKRDDIGISFRSVGSNSEWSAGVANSKENDYESISVHAGYTRYFNNKNQSLNIGLSYSDDKINAVDADVFIQRPQEEEDKSSVSLTIGGSRNISSTFVVGASYTYANYEGFLSDPYKLVSVGNLNLADSRPESRDQSAFNVMTRKYFSGANAALHMDYRYFQNSWGVKSYTISGDWHQNLGAGWQIVPGIRYYIQDEARFFQNTFDEEPENGFYSSDYRLSGFDAISYRLKLSKTFGKHSVNLAYEGYEATAIDDDKASPALVEYNHVSIGFDLNF